MDPTGLWTLGMASKGDSVRTIAGMPSPGAHRPWTALGRPQGPQACTTNDPIEQEPKEDLNGRTNSDLIHHLTGH